MNYARALCMFATVFMALVKAVWEFTAKHINNIHILSFDTQITNAFLRYQSVHAPWNN